MIKILTFWFELVLRRRDDPASNENRRLLHALRGENVVLHLMWSVMFARTDPSGSLAARFAASRGVSLDDIIRENPIIDFMKWIFENQLIQEWLLFLIENGDKLLALLLALIDIFSEPRPVTHSAPPTLENTLAQPTTLNPLA